jgi:hypothetical protein
MSRRICKSAAHNIAVRIMRIKMIPETNAQIAELRSDTLRRYSAYIPDEVKDFDSKFPGYINRSNSVIVRNSIGHSSYVHFENEVIVIQYDSYLTVSDEDFAVFASTYDKIRNIKDDIRRMRLTIQNKIQGRSVKGVCDTWPEACAIVREVMGDDVQLPATINTKLNSELGLPVNEKVKEDVNE